MKIHCDDKTIDAVLGEGYFRIPRFQRPYSWDRDNVEEFWNDTVEEPGSDYFIGSMVVFEGKDCLGIVDGQQRLTTITMVLCAARDALRKAGLDELARGVQTKIERPDIQNKPRFILQSETSSPFLQETIQSWDGPDVAQAKVGREEGRLQEAFELVGAKVMQTVETAQGGTSLSGAKRAHAVARTLERIRDRMLALRVIFIRIDDEDDAYVIFETMNTRGKDLRVSDLVKNYLTRLIRAKHAEVDLAKDAWGEVVQTIEGSGADLSVDSFLHHLWLSRYQYTTVQTLFKKLKKRVTKPEAKGFLDSLVHDAATYRAIQAPKFRQWTRAERPIRESLDALNLFRVRQDLPMLLSVMREYGLGHLRPKHVARILGAIEHFHFLFTAVASQRSSGGISLMYALHARDLFDASTLDDKVQVLEALVKKLRDRRPVYPEFEARFVEIAYSSSNTTQKKLVQYILAKRDRHFASGPPLDYDAMTIEHLAPESPKTGPKLPKSDVERIGNLILVGGKLNSEDLRNKGFAEKKPLLLTAGVWVDDTVREAPTWEGTQIEERSKALARLAYDKVWRI